ncbi:MAG: response regulator [Spirochaetales bacterium]|nr:response regulator [Spirochaetales bacterium]
MDMKKEQKIRDDGSFIEENLYQVQKMEALSRLAGGIAHDFNNIFSGIQGYLKILQMKLKNDKALEQELGEVLSGIKAASRLTGRLIEYSRRDIKRPSLLNLNHYLHRIRERCEIFLGNRIDFNLELDPELYLVSLDVHQCDRIIDHLLENAKDAIGSEGFVKISTENKHYSGGDSRIPPGKYVSIRFSDNGSGIDPAIRERIFEPFYSTKGGKATGLGLSTIYGLVKQNNGVISLCSEENTGVTFEILLPAITDRATKLDPDDGKVIGGSEGVLLVDDEDIVRPLVKKILDDYGYHVWEAHDGHEALEIFLENRDKIHLCLTDVIMPGIKGNELAAKLLEIKPNLKIIYISGYPENIISNLGVLDNGVNFVYKPFTAKVLLNKIRDVFDG